MNARRVVLWKDVPGILTADPRLVPDARLIPQLHHREAGEVAHYGAKVLHPRALIPIAGTRVEMHVRSFLTPDAPGTEVSARRSLQAYPVKALAIVRDQAIVTVAGKGMAGVHGIAARTFSAVEAERLSVSTIFQASSESSIGFTLPESEADRAVRSIRQMFSGEIASGLIDNVTAKPGMAVLAVVGDGMAGTPGIAARVFSALATAQINVVAIAQGSSERNISFAVNGDDAADAARCVHAAFQLSKIGGGRAASRRPGPTSCCSDSAGSAARSPIRSPRRPTISRRCAWSACSIARDTSSSRAGSRAAGCSIWRRRRMAARCISSLGGRKANAAEALTTMAAHAVSRPIIVDVTSEETGDLLRTAIGHGFNVVLANKKPLAESWERYNALLADRRTNGGPRVKYEATVGAGLPIIDTYQKLVETGDRVLRDRRLRQRHADVHHVGGVARRSASRTRCGGRSRRATPSRTRARICPGMDAARKGLILARLLGYRGAAPTPHEPGARAAARRSRSTSSSRSCRRSTRSGRTAPRARSSNGRVLRYVVTATPRSVSAKLAAVPASSPMGALEGTRNLIAFTTRRYRNEPLVVSGPGAGPAVTAAGILNDIYSLAGR